MKMQKRKIFPLQVVLLLLMLLGSSSSLFSATPEVQFDHQKEQQDLLGTSLPGEVVPDLFDSTLPVQKTIIFFYYSTGGGVDLKDHFVIHTTTSQDYIKRSRLILPSLGVRETIFPFHVFL